MYELIFFIYLDGGYKIGEVFDNYYPSVNVCYQDGAKKAKELRGQVKAKYPNLEYFIPLCRVKTIDI